MNLRVSMLALVIVLAALAVALLGGGGSNGGGALDPVAQAAETTTHAGGAHMSFTASVSISALSSPIALSGQGAFNFKTAEGDLTMQMSGLPAAVAGKLGGGALQMTELFKAGDVYIGSPLFASTLPNGARWLRLDLARVQQAAGLDPSSLTSGNIDPAQYLRDLRSAGATRLVGHERVRGVPSTHYSGQLDLLKAAESQPGANRTKVRAAFAKLLAASGLRSIPIDVWVDTHGLVRKVALKLAVAPAGQRVSADIAMEYFDFGATPSIAVPASSEVFDSTAAALKPLGG